MRKIIYLNEANDFEDFNDTEELEFDDDLNEGAINEESDGPAEPKEPMDDEKLRVESVKLATSIAKLMSNVTPEDIIKLAGIVASYIRNNNASADLNVNDEEEELEGFGDFEEEEAE